MHRSQVLPLFLPFLNSGVFMGHAVTSRRNRSRVIFIVLSYLSWYLDCSLTILTWSSESNGCPRFSILNAVLVNHPCWIPFGGSAWLTKVKSLQALFALATEVLRLFGDFADQVLDSAKEGSRESSWTSSFCHASMAYCNNYILYTYIIFKNYIIIICD